SATLRRSIRRRSSQIPAFEVIDMNRKTPLLPFLGLALLLAGVLACNPAPEQEEAATSDMNQTAPASPAPAPASPAPANPAAGQTPGTATAPGAPADNKMPLAANDLPEVVAKVNGKPIRKLELIQAAQVVQLQLAQRGQPVMPSAMFYRQVLEQIIAITLLQQDAKAQGVAASDQEVQR